MGTFYQCCAALDFEEGALASWLDAPPPASHWPTEPSLRALFARLAAGGDETNGTRIPSLVVTLEPACVRWSWGRVPSEVAPEVLALGRALWSSAQTCALRGVFGYRDELGPEALWDRAEVFEAGRLVRVERWLPVLFSTAFERGDRTAPSTDDDIAF